MTTITPEARTAAAAAAFCRRIKKRPPAALAPHETEELLYLLSRITGSEPAPYSWRDGIHPDAGQK